MNKIMVNTEHAAEMLDLSKSTFEGLVRSGKINKPKKVSERGARFLVSELIAFAESCPASDLLPPPNTAEGGRRSKKLA